MRLLDIDLPDLDDGHRVVDLVLITKTVDLDTGEHAMQTIASAGLSPWELVGLLTVATRDALDGQDDEP